MLKDLLSKKVLEIDSIKKKVRRKIEGSDIDLTSFDPHDKITKADTEYAKDILSEVYESAFHADRNLATVAMVSYRVFERFHLEMDFYCKSSGYVKSGIKKGSFYYFFNSTLEYIESCAVRSVEFPKKLTVLRNPSYGIKGRPLLPSDNLNTLKGLEQGPLYRHDRFDAAGYFLEVIGFNVNENNYLMAKAYFSATKSNSLALFLFVDKRISVPLEIDVSKDRESLFDKEVLYFIGFSSHRRSNDKGTFDIFHIYYANISDYYKFVNNSLLEEFEDVFGSCFGSDFFDVKFYKDSQVVRVTVLKKKAYEHYLNNERSICYNAYAKSGKGFWEFVFKSLLKNPSLSYCVFCHGVFNFIRGLGAVLLNSIERLRKKLF